MKQIQNEGEQNQTDEMFEENNENLEIPASIVKQAEDLSMSHDFCTSDNPHIECRRSSVCEIQNQDPDSNEASKVKHFATEKFPKGILIISLG